MSGTATDSSWGLVHDVAFERVRRMVVPGGWLYQTEIDQLHEVLRVGEDSARVIGWYPPVFVPDAGSGSAGPDPKLRLALDQIASRILHLRGDMATVGGNSLVEIVGDIAELLREVRP